MLFSSDVRVVNVVEVFLIIFILCKIGNKVQSKMAAVAELWVQLFSCCVAQPQQKRHRIRIDRSMIGAPMNFQHTGHIGSRDVELPNDQLTALQMQMMSKGGYETSYKDPDWCH